jgi:hypothetical protein
VNSISPSLLAGLVFDETGDRMTPTHANKKGTRYRYYVSRGLIGGGTDPGENTGRRIAAGDLERIVQTRVMGFLSDETAIHGAIQTIEPNGNDRRRIMVASAALAKQWSVQSADRRRAMLVDLLSRIDVRARSIDLIVRPDAIVRIATSGIDVRDETSRQDDNPTIDISIPIRLKRVGREMKLVIDAPNGTPAKADPVLLRLLAKAQRYRNILLAGESGSIQELANKEGVSRPYFSSVVRLGFLSPDIIEAIVQGEQLNRLSAKWLLKNTALPLDWSTQREMLGFV